MIRADYLVEVQQNPPLCDKKGMYKRVQLKHVSGDRYIYYCADVHDGSMIGKEVANLWELSCVGTRISFRECVMIFMAVQTVVMLFDGIWYWRKKQGMLAHMVGRTKHQQYFRVDDWFFSFTGLWKGENQFNPRWCHKAGNTIHIRGRRMGSRLRSVLIICIVISEIMHCSYDTSILEWSNLLKF